jgi:hypothetical protein
VRRIADNQSRELVNAATTTEIAREPSRHQCSLPSLTVTVDVLAQRRASAVKCLPQPPRPTREVNQHRDH